jgi:phosphoenolpyruvate carboxykinase (GTP)
MAGYKVWTLGDDIAWLRIGEDGRLWAINPETGLFGVAPGTSKQTNANALLTTHSNTIFTNVLLAEDQTVWWEGMGVDPPRRGVNWKGDPWTPDSQEPGAHPNARFTAPLRQVPNLSLKWEDPRGVPISAILFGGRRAKVAPLVYQAFGWEHGVFMGATMASETTAAALGDVGVVRRDPMAMLPFCGYNIGDYFAHWLAMGQRIAHPPKIFNVNWFQRDSRGQIVWPGFGENLRVLQWIVSRCREEVGALTSPIGYLPQPQDIDIAGLDGISRDTLAGLLQVDREVWMEEMREQGRFLAGLDRLPEEIKAQYNDLVKRWGFATHEITPL